MGQWSLPVHAAVHLLTSPGTEHQLTGQVRCQCCLLLLCVCLAWHNGLCPHLELPQLYGITCEGLARAIGRNTTYQSWEASCLGPLAVRRFHAVLASPLLAMSSLSNFYFFTGTEVGHIFVRRVCLESWPVGLPTILFFLYCCSQTSIEVKNYEIKKQILAGRDRRE